MLTGKQKYDRRYARRGPPAPRRVRWYLRPQPPQPHFDAGQVFRMPGRGGYATYETPLDFLKNIFLPRMKGPLGAKPVELKAIGVGRGGIPMYREVPRRRGKEYPRKAQ